MGKKFLPCKSIQSTGIIVRKEKYLLEASPSYIYGKEDYCGQNSKRIGKK
jgi:hypothetical protein